MIISVIAKRLLTPVHCILIRLVRSANKYLTPYRRFVLVLLMSS